MARGSSCAAGTTTNFFRRIAIGFCRYWAERQFDPRDPAFLPRGFNLYTINYTHRDWTMIGNPLRTREAIVDPRGLVTPWFDGWSLDVWLEVDGKLFSPSRLADTEIEQSLHENLPIVVTTFQARTMCACA